MRKIYLFIAILVFTFTCVNAQKKASELTPSRGWLNTETPLSIEKLRGKVVLLDFWTYGCVNCMHIIPNLKRLEAKFANELVVIGVHSAKFSNEGQTENIRKIILRYGIDHAVANDADFKIWRSYDVEAYPTLIFIDAEGKIRHRIIGEGKYEDYEKNVTQLVNEAKASGKLNSEPLKLVLEKAKAENTPLRFPSKIIADEKNQRLFISDNGHNRIVIAKFDGTLIDVIGNGKTGLVDGKFTDASFHSPNGMALDGDKLYVADTVNHSIRLVNLATKTVSTIAGIGSQVSYKAMSGIANKTGLNSPWDLQLVGNQLFIAIAGQHQIWMLDLASNQIGVYAGSGYELREDGELLESAFSQPSGLLTIDNKMYVADSEANIIREINFINKEVTTLVGGDLYDFGDTDGQGDDVRLQHPLGLAKFGTSLLIADTYNHKIKILDVKKNTVKTFLGTGKSGNLDGKNPTFWEPSGIVVVQNNLYIADANNNAIRVVDLTTKEAKTLVIKGLK